MVLELARHGAFDGPVAGVVDTRRQLVDEELAADVEQLDGEDAGVRELVEELACDLLPGVLESCGHVGRGPEAPAEDAVGVMVLDEGPARRGAVATAHGEDRELPVERDVRLENQRVGTKLRERSLDVALLAEDDLALAVVA